MKITVEGTDLAMLECSKRMDISTTEFMSLIRLAVAQKQVVQMQIVEGMATFHLEPDTASISVAEEPKSSSYRLPTRHFGARSDLDLTRLAHVDEDAV